MLRERKRLRLKDFDYSSDNAYFVTFNTKNSDNWFCYIEDGIMNLNVLGKIVEKCWYDLLNHYKNCILDEFVIMPNHFHGIIIIDNELIAEYSDLKPSPTEYLDLKPSITNEEVEKIKIYGLQEMIRALKSFSSRRINELISKYQFINNIEIPKYQWHRSFHEKIIRDEKAFINIKNYIKNNPINWNNDENNKKLNRDYSKFFLDNIVCGDSVEDLINGVEDLVNVEEGRRPSSTFTKSSNTTLNDTKNTTILNNTNETNEKENINNG